MSEIKSAIERLFKKHRLVFWYDSEKEFSAEFEQLELNGAEKLEVALAGFGLKYFLLKEKPDVKFLLYFPFAEPSPEENFVLDLQLSNAQFRTDKASLFAQELDLPLQLKEVIDDHLSFFNSKERRQKLKKILPEKVDNSRLLMAMLRVVFGRESSSVEHFLFEYAASYLRDKEQISKELDRFKLLDHFWSLVHRSYHYSSEKPNIYDFFKHIFKRASKLFPDADPDNAGSFLLNFWQDSLTYQEAFREWSIMLGEDLSIKEKLNDFTYQFLASESIFRDPELKAISDLATQPMSSAREIEEALSYIQEKKISFWYGDLSYFYLALDHGLRLWMVMLKAEDIRFSDFKDGLESYRKKWSRVDYYYRKFIYFHRNARQNKVFESLYDRINKRYSNVFLLNMSTAWQGLIDSNGWKLPFNTDRQRQFFTRTVQPLLEKQRTVVIISDGLRYEAGMELMERFRKEKRFEASIDYAVSEVPSYTQLGMAALLPHNKLRIEDQGTHVLANDLSTQGLQGRGKVLREHSKVSAVAVNAKDIMQMPTMTEGRDFVKKYDLIYVYHNAIDKEGDDKVTEHRVFDAVEEEFDYLINLCKSLTNMNITRIVITADHGFLYENEPLSKADFNVEGVQGEEVWSVSRRFALGKGLKTESECMHFKAEDLELEGDFELLVPKYMNRFRVRGAGSRYVHGGMSLQELVIPVLTISKKREETARQVDIDIIKSTEKITSNILPITFIQSEVITDYVHSRRIKSFLQTEDGKVISDVFIGNFEFDDELDRQRKKQHFFHLKPNVAEKYNKQYVKLVLQEPVDSDNWRHYKDFVYILNISVNSDFDFDL
ncbi:MAG: BREX-1 system phosphatase PglZ type A [Saprospirales bacterium]|nr:MAG: BREX-1 system phosphatase PglZ type A [Saprospirales bacterium]